MSTWSACQSVRSRRMRRLCMSAGQEEPELLSEVNKLKHQLDVGMKLNEEAVVAKIKLVKEDDEFATMSTKLTSLDEANKRLDGQADDLEARRLLLMSDGQIEVSL
ncbi:Uncharacterized protein Fot_10838 [Forsythia ovata]|uniref:Uncharacterized protein n=1 Tax=Forsythia ovata TaxID=205694 RepID=A0ABD1WKL6_9LAMI